MIFFYWGNDIKSQTQVTTAQMSNLYKTKTFNTIGVHDPSVVFNSKDGKYYIYGSHYAGAVSTDLRNWTAIGNYYNTTYDRAFKKSPARKVKRTLNGVVEEVDFPSFDAAACGRMVAESLIGYLKLRRPLPSRAFESVCQTM